MEDFEIQPQETPEPPDTSEQDAPEPVAETAHALPQTISIEEWMASSAADEEEAPAPAVLEDVQLLAVLEACVYVAEEPLMPAQIAAALNQDVERIQALLRQLLAEFDRPEHGVSIKEIAGGYKMATKAEHHEAVRNFVKSLKPPLKLSLPALETLAVVAYKQPVTSPEIMEIRGVQGGGVLKTLLDRRLVTEAGRKNVIGKPILYKTTKEFLIQFGLKDLSELPTLKEFEEIRRMAMAESEVPVEAPAVATSAPVAEVQGPEAVAEETPAETSASEVEAAAAAESSAPEALAEEIPSAESKVAGPESPAQEEIAEDTPAPEGSAPEGEAAAAESPAPEVVAEEIQPAESAVAGPASPSAGETVSEVIPAVEASASEVEAAAPETHAVAEENPSAEKSTAETEAAVDEDSPAAEGAAPEAKADAEPPAPAAPAAGHPAPPESQDQ